MKKILYVLLFSCFNIIIFSCSSEDIPSIKNVMEKISSNLRQFSDSGSTSSSANSNVYIVGYAVTEKCTYPNCPKSKVVLWDLAGNMTVLEDSCSPADATTHNDYIYITGNTQYCVVGPDKNVVVFDLDEPSDYVQNSLDATGIAVSSNGDVYISGTALKNNKRVSVYWKNGELINYFSQNSDWDSEKNVAADSKGNVYMPGWMMKSHSVTYATYWKNGNLKKLTTTYDGEAKDVDVSGNKVYFSGAHGPICDLPCPPKSGTLAAYWQVGKGMTKVTKVKTADIPRKYIMRSRPSSIHVEGSTVYMAGEIDGYVPVYWKNKKQHELEVNFDTFSCDRCRAVPNDISVFDGKVIVVGDYNDEKDKVNRAVYWLDKKLHILCENCSSSYATAVVVKN